MLMKLLMLKCCNHFCVGSVFFVFADPVGPVVGWTDGRMDRTHRTDERMTGPMDGPTDEPRKCQKC